MEDLPADYNELLSIVNGLHEASSALNDANRIRESDQRYEMSVPESLYEQLSVEVVARIDDLIEVAPSFRGDRIAETGIAAEIADAAWTLRGFHSQIAQILIEQSGLSIRMITSGGMGERGSTVINIVNYATRRREDDLFVSKAVRA